MDLQAQGRHDVPVPHARAPHRFRRAGAGVDLEPGGRHHRAPGGRTHAPRARRAGPDRRQRHGRDLVRPEPDLPALQSAIRGDVRLPAGRDGRPEHRAHLPDAGGIRRGGRRALPAARRRPHQLRGAAAQAQGRRPFLVPRGGQGGRPRQLARRLDLDLRRRQRGARVARVAAGLARRPGARGRRAHRRAAGGKRAPGGGDRRAQDGGRAGAASRRPRCAHRAAEPAPARGPPDAGARAQLPQPQADRGDVRRPRPLQEHQRFSATRSATRC